MELALAADNAGPTTVESVGGPPPDGTKTYADDIIARWQKLAGCS
jgi:hypothetical protein